MSVAGKGGRPPGLPKTGGRKKGTPNKASLAVAEQLSAMGCYPVAILAGIAMNEMEETPHRIRAASELLSYCYPKRAPVPDLTQVDAQLTVKTAIEEAPVAPSSADTGDEHNSTDT